MPNNTSGNRFVVNNMQQPGSSYPNNGGLNSQNSINRSNFPSFSPAPVHTVPSSVSHGSSSNINKSEFYSSSSNNLRPAISEVVSVPEHLGTSHSII